MTCNSRSWQNWPSEEEFDEDEEMEEVPPPQSPRSSWTNSSSSPSVTSGAATPFNQSPSQSPKPFLRPLLNPSPQPTDDVMKLPLRDMQLFGQCPVQDEFVLAVCDICHRSLRLEALNQHIRLRHERSVTSGPPENKTSIFLKSRGSKNKQQIKPCTVELTKEDLTPLSTTSGSSPFSSGQTTPSTSRASSIHSVPLKDASPIPFKDDVLMHPVDIKPKEFSSSKSLPPPVMQIKTENESQGNVISIPDTDPLPHAMSNDLMAMVSGEIKEEGSGNSRNSSFKLESSSLIKLQLNSITNPNSSINLANRAKFPHQTPIQIIDPTPSPSKKSNPSKKGSAKGDRKPLREYHPDKHCGVWDNDSKRHCTRALTCKSHSVLLKRKISGRTKSFDELVADYKASKEAQALAVAAQRSLGQMPAPLPPPKGMKPTSAVPINVEDVLNSITEPNPIEPSRMQQVNGVKPRVIGTAGWSPVSSLIGVSGSPKPIFSPSQFNGNKKASKEPDENLHYTSDHPKPMAVCSLGGKRIGGLLVADRSQIYTRKLIRVAITSNGLRVKNKVNNRFNPIQPVTKKNVHVLQPRGHQVTLGNPSPNTGNYVVNYNLTPNLTVSGHQPNRPKNFIQTPVIASGSMPRIANVSLATSNPSGIGGTISHINLAANSESSFRTDIQDFKGGIKFELGRKIKPILPSGVSK